MGNLRAACAFANGFVSRRKFVALLACAAAIVVACAEPGPAVAPPTAESATPVHAEEILDFVHDRQVVVGAADQFGWLLQDTEGMTLRGEDDRVAAAVIADLRGVEVSPGARHLYYWTYESHGVRQLHVFDTVTLAAPRVVLETAIRTKLPLAWTAEEQFVAFPLPERPDMTRVVDLVTGSSVEAATNAVRALPIWASPASIPSIDPGTTMPKVDTRATRPDGSATTYLAFDASAGGRWFGERVEVPSGRRTPVEWNTGGNPSGIIRLGARTGATIRYENAPPRENGKLGASRALWSVRQNVGSAVRREAVRAMPYSDWIAFGSSYSTGVPRDLEVYVVIIEAEDPEYFSRGGVSCRELFALLRSDGRFEGAGGGCMGNVWPASLPAAFATPDFRDWTSPKGTATPGPSQTPSIRR
jgi:hypothetical protein